MRYAVAVVLLLACVPVGQGQDQGQGRTLVTVHADREAGTVNRQLLGANQLAWGDGSELYRRRGAGIWDPEKRQPVAEYVRAAQTCGLALARWPGDCAAHTWDWKATVGALEQRPDQAFGLPEFLTWCREARCTPVITIGAFAGTDRDAADLVEYLNAPNNGGNPNGGTDWAAARAADGHMPPHDVIWFEFDGAAFHGDDTAPAGNGRRRISPEQYADRYLALRRALRAVDPRVKLGAAVPLEVETWSHPVLEAIGDRMDFAVTDLRLPTWYGDASPEQSTLLLQASLAAPAQAEAALDAANALVEELCGRTDLPWLISDWGNLYVQEKPVPYRYTLAAALGHAELLRILMEPRQRVAMAACRQFANPDWGLIQGYVHRREPLRPQAQALVYELYASHFGDTRLEVSVAGDTWTFPGAAGVLARSPEFRPRSTESDELLPRTAAWTVTSLPDVPQNARGTLLAVDFPSKETDFRHAAIRLPAKRETWYRVRAMLKTEKLNGATGACLEVGDGRPESAARPGVFSHDVVGDCDWTEVVVDYRVPEDAEALVITARRRTLGGAAGAGAGRAFYRVYSVREITLPDYGPVADVSAHAARRKNGVVTVMLVNTNLGRDQSVTLQFGGLAIKPTSQAQVWLLSAPTPWSTNLGREDKVRVLMPSPARVESGWTVSLPRHAMAAVEITP